MERSELLKDFKKFARTIVPFMGTIQNSTVLVIVNGAEVIDDQEVQIVKFQMSFLVYLITRSEEESSKQGFYQLGTPSLDSIYCCWSYRAIQQTSMTEDFVLDHIIKETFGRFLVEKGIQRSVK